MASELFCDVLIAKCPKCGAIISAEADLSGNRDDVRFGRDVRRAARKLGLHLRWVKGPVRIGRECHCPTSPDRAGTASAG